MTTDTSSDKRERMQALSLVKECYAMKLDLLSSATVVDRAIQFVENHPNQSQDQSHETDKDSLVIIMRNNIKTKRMK